MTKTITQNNALLRAQLLHQLAEIECRVRKLRRKILWLRIRDAFRSRVFPITNNQ